MSGKKYTVTVEFYDPNPSGDPARDVRRMLMYGEKRTDYVMQAVGEISVEDWEEEEC